MNKVLYEEIMSNLNNIINAQEFSKINAVIKEYLSNNRTTSGFKTVYRALYDSCLKNVKLYSLKGWAVIEFNKLYKEINYDLIKQDSFELETVLLMGDSRFDKSKLNNPVEEKQENIIIPLEEIEVEPVTTNQVEVVNTVALNKEPVNNNVIEMKDLAVNADGVLAANLELERVLDSIEDKRDFVDVNMVVVEDEIYNTKGIRTKDAKSRIARISKDTLTDILSSVNYLKEKKRSVKDKIKVLSKDELEIVKRYLKISETFNLFEEKVNNVFAIRQERMKMKQNEPIGFVDASLDKMKTI